jgi:hypothetical protein
MISKITQEINDYRNGSVEILEGVSYSAAKLIRRIGLYKAQVYPNGKLDSQGNYKYWFDVITPRVNSEIKNIDFDTKDVILFSDAINDSIRIILANAALREWFNESGQAGKLNEAIEQGPEWGNVVWKKQDKDYRILELSNVMVLNQTAKTLEFSDVIEEECFLATDLRKMSKIWKNTEELIKSAKAGLKSSPEFYVYERNGEMSEKEYYQAKKMMDKSDADISKYSDSKFMLCKVIAGGNTKDKPTEILFCTEITKKPYKEYHRSSYAGRWLRLGLYEQLMDIQTRANEIGNQIARGLEWASKTVFRSGDKVIAQNILTDLQSGDIIKSNDLQQVNVRMEGLDQLLADWNRLMQSAGQIANSYEIVSGASLPSGTPFRLGILQNTNANKLYDFIREKLGIVLQEVIEEWILPSAIKDLKQKDVLRLTQDSESLNSYFTALVDSWYIQNLLTFPPHTSLNAKEMKAMKLKELQSQPQTMVKLESEMWKEFYPRVRVAITGENYNLAVDLETLQTFIALEQDPIRRTALIEIAMKKKNIDVSTLPKTPTPEEQQASAQAMGAMPSPLSGNISSRA